MREYGSRAELEVDLEVTRVRASRGGAALGRRTAGGRSAGRRRGGARDRRRGHPPGRAVDLDRREDGRRWLVEGLRAVGEARRGVAGRGQRDRELAGIRGGVTRVTPRRGGRRMAVTMVVVVVVVVVGAELRAGGRGRPRRPSRPTPCACDRRRGRRGAGSAGPRPRAATGRRRSPRTRVGGAAWMPGRPSPPH